MRIRSNLKGTKGWLYMRERSIRFRYMISETAKHRTKILTFWKKHGTEAVEEAYGIKRRTLYLWQKNLKDGNGKLEALNPGNRAPEKKRMRLWDARVLEELKQIRFKHPNLGKEKLHPILSLFCARELLACPSPRTIGRLILDAGGLRHVPLRITGTGRIKPLVRVPALRKPKGFEARYPGHCVALDTFEEHINGTRRYVITFIDIYTRFGFAFATSSHASKAAAEFFGLCASVFPFPFTHVLTDNGSEFKKYFSAAVLELHLTHFHTRPRTPKQNAHSERFNRTVQEEFANYHRTDLWLDIASFNQKLFAWLYWYNTERVHFAFGNKLSPLQFILLVAAVIAEAAQRVVAGAARAAGVRAANLLGALARASIWIFAILVALERLGVSPLIQTLFTGIVVALALAFGLAFGLGGQAAAAKYIEKIQNEIK